MHWLKQMGMMIDILIDKEKITATLAENRLEDSWKRLIDLHEEELEIRTQISCKYREEVDKILTDSDGRRTLITLKSLNEIYRKMLEELNECHKKYFYLATQILMENENNDD